MTTFLQVKNDAVSTLAADITNTATSLSVAAGDGAKFPQPGDGFHITIDNEILKCTARTGDTLTVTRAQEGTTAAAHSAGVAVRLNITAAIISELQAHDPLTTGVHGIEDYQGRRISLLNPYKSKANRYKVQLHCHTTNSDGVDTPTALMTAYKNAGYHACAITDHDYLTPDPGVTDILHIPGVEESPTAGHITNLACTAQSTSTVLQTIIDDILLDGALAAPAHPWWSSRPIYQDILQSLIGNQLIEIANQKVSPVLNDSLWDFVLTRGVNAWAIGVDDCHDIAGTAFDKCFVEVMADTLSVAAIKESLREGNLYVRQTGAPQLTVSVSGNAITVTSDVAMIIRFIGRNGLSLSLINNVTSASYTVKGWEGYIRIRAMDQATSTYRAWTQPIWILSYPKATHLRKFTQGWTSGKLLKGAGVDANPTEVFLAFLDEPWVGECWLVDPEDAASFWNVEKAAGASFTEKRINRLDFSTGATLNNYIRLFSDGVPGGVYDNVYFAALTQWAGTVRTASSVYIGVWETNTARRPSLTAKHYGWKVIDGAIWATVADGTSESAVDTGITYDTNWRIHTLVIHFVNSTIGFQFYVDGVLKATINTNIPSFSASLVYMDIVTTDAVDKRIMIKGFNWRLV